MFTSSSTCDTLFYSKLHTILNCLYLVVLFAMNLSYWFISNPCYVIVFEHRSYHSSVESMNIYWAFIIGMYSTFNKLFTPIFLLCSGFTLHMMSTNYPSIFNRMNLSSGMSALSYDPGTSKLPHLFLRVHQLWIWGTKFPGKWSVIMSLL